MLPQPNGYRGMQWVEQSSIGENINFSQKSQPTSQTLSLSNPTQTAPSGGCEYYLVGGELAPVHYCRWPHPPAPSHAGSHCPG